MSPSSQPTWTHVASPRLFGWVFAVSCVVKVALAATVPLTGDEAYFVLWGSHPDYGYYDHPPMIGWWLWAIMLLGDAPVLVRLPGMLVPLAVALVIRSMLRELDREKADLVATLFLLLPFNSIAVLTTTDTPLIFFSALSAWFAFLAHRRGRRTDALLAGVFLGGAFLSKYFAVVLGLAYAVHFLGVVGPRKGLVPLLWIFLGVLPAAAVNVAWNYEYGWTNIMFNLYTRHSSAVLSPVGPAVFVLMTLYWLGPGIVWVVLASRRAWWGDLRLRWRAAREDGLALFVSASLVPAAVFFSLSWLRTVGMHWLMSFFALFFPVLFAWMGAENLRRMLRPTAWFAGVQAVIVLVAVQLPLDRIAPAKQRQSVLLGTSPETVLAALEPWRADHMLTTGSYSKSALLEYFTGERVPVLGAGSPHGRQDDLLTDFRTLEGRNMLFLESRRERAAVATGWFRASELRDVEVRGITYAVLIGKGFDYEAYRADALQLIADRFYRVPWWLARMMRGSFFLERYDLQPTPQEPPAG